MRGKYPDSACGNFRIKTTIGVPHPYCITPKHVAYAADHCGGMLGEDAIRESEKHGARCDICKGKLKYEEHEQALVVGCKVDPKDKPVSLQEWLKAIAPIAEKNGYVGFAFTKE